MKISTGIGFLLKPEFDPELSRLSPLAFDDAPLHSEDVRELALVRDALRRRPSARIGEGEYTGLVVAAVDVDDVGEATACFS